MNFDDDDGVIAVVVVSCNHAMLVKGYSNIMTFLKEFSGQVKNGWKHYSLPYKRINNDDILGKSLQYNSDQLEVYIYIIQNYI